MMGKMNEVDCIIELSNNLFFLSNIICSFIKGFSKCDNRKLDMFYLYLILPNVLYFPSRKKLKDARVDSSLRSLFFSRGENFSCTGDLNSRIIEYYSITNEALIIGINSGKIQLKDKGKNILIEITEKIIENSKLIDDNEYNKAAYYFGIIASKMDVITLYRELGVTKL